MRFKKLVILSLVFLFFISLSPFAAFSQIENEAQGITISPPLSEYQIKPGETVTQKIKVTNPVARQVKVFPYAFDFKAKGETGEPAFLAPTSERRNFSLANWLIFSKGVLILEPQEVEVFEYTIKVPQDAEPGGHYGVIFFGTEPPKPEGKDVNQVAIASMVGSLILAKVPGYIIEKGTLETFSAPFLLLKPPVEFLVRIANIGNIHFKPKGEIKIKNWRGKVIDAVEFNKEDGNVLPDSTRRFEPQWQPKKAIGFYRAELDLKYGESQKELKGSLWFLVIPLWLLIILLLLLASLITFIIWLVKKRRKKKKEPAEHEHKIPPRRIILR